MCPVGKTDGSDVGPADRRPELSQLLRTEDVRMWFEPFLELGIDGAVLFDRDGVPHGGAANPASPLSGWEQLSPEAHACVDGIEGGFGLAGYRFEVRAAFAGADRVGTLVCSRRDDGDRDTLRSATEALSLAMAQVLRAEFSAWMTAEMHLAASESSYLAVKRQNAELRRAMDHLRELDKLKSNFLATVSHELRTPLTSVIGFSEMLLEGLAGELTAEQRDYVKTIFDRGDELLHLITQILEMSRLEMGVVKLDLQPCYIETLLEKAVDTVNLTLTRGGIDLAIQLGPAAGEPILVDPDKIHQVLVNLLVNAAKFTRPGGTVTVTTDLAPIRRPFTEETLFGEEVADALRVSVRDTGVGIPKEQLMRIFDAFYQVDAGPTREHGGAGLGLAIVKSLVSAHGGEVWAESTVGVGTTFRFTLPRAPRRS